MSSLLPTSAPLTPTEDMRLYFWIPASEVGYLQAVIDAEDNLGRIRTERQHEGRALILLMSDWSRASEISELLRNLQQESDISIEFVDSIKQLPV